MKDIENRADIKFLVDSFYKQVVTDPVIGYIFTEVAKLNLEKHMPIMYNFWQSVLLDEMTYKGNPILKHLELNQKEPLQAKHFEQWLSLWEASVHENFKGPVADEAIKRASLMAILMQHKIKLSASDQFIQ